MSRQTADYDTDFDLDCSAVHEFIEEGRNFLVVARAYLGRQGMEIGGPGPVENHKPGYTFQASGFLSDWSRLAMKALPARWINLCEHRCG